MSRRPSPDLAHAFARAFLASLTSAETAQLQAILTRGGQVTAEDLQSLPALKHLTETPRGAMSPDIRAALTALGLGPGPADGARWFDHSDAPFIAITKGVDQAIQLSADLAPTEFAENLNLGLFNTVLALKSGNSSQADAMITILSEHFEIPTLEECGPGFAPELSCVLFMKAIYSDEDISDRATERLFDVLSELPKDSPLLRAILYNVALDVFFRQHRVAEAEQAAHRAVFHYGAADEPGVTFYVHLYLAVIRLWDGQPEMAQLRLGDARAALDAFEGAVENDHLLLRSFDMIAAYDHSDQGPFIAHLMSETDTIPFGELWPSIAEPIISYGRRALASKVTPAAALAWVRRWRLRQRRSLRFDALISVQEALALQELGRWQEADEVLGALTNATGPEAQIARLASGLDRNPKSQELARQIAAALARPTLSMRQRVALRLMATESALARRVEREAARHLSQAVHDADPDTHPAIWSEQSAKVAEVLSKRELRAELRRFPRLQRQVQSLGKVEATRKPDALTRQEFRVLQLLAEAQSNKAIAHRLGISLPTVKFHVANLCRKTMTDNRRAVVQSAIDAGWLSEA